MRILVAESSRFSTRAEAILREVGDVMMADLDRAGLLHAVRDADALWVRLRHRVDAELLAQASNLKFLVSPTTGLNHIDLLQLERRNIELISLRGQTDFLKDIRATAEHTIALSLALIRNLVRACGHASSGGWNRDLFWGHELHHKTIGVVGYGRLGRMVAEYFKAFGCRVVTTDPFVSASEVASDVSLLPLAELLARADLVTLHVSLNASTEGLFGAPEFARMKASSWFINTSRGELVDERALLDALENAHLAGAALDVLSDEDPAGMNHHSLVQYAQSQDNLILTPHIGGCTFESIEKTEVFAAEKLRTLLLEAGTESKSERTEKRLG